MRETIESGICQCCGAPITSEICLYCGMPTGIDTARANMEYPVIECKEAVLTFWNLWFPAIFAISFGFPGAMVLVLMLMSGQGWTTVLFCIPFLLIGIVAAYLVIRVVVRYILVKLRGKKITATVYGYMDDNVFINGVPAQIVKLLIQTQEGPRFIMYQLGDTKQLYGINTQVHLIVYRNYFMIDKNGENISWR